MVRPFHLLLCAIALASLAGCGKAGRPQQPADSLFPRVYPNPADTPSNAAAKTSATDKKTVPEKDSQFTAKGSYIDPSTKVTSGTAVVPTSNLPNTTTQSNDLFSQGIGGPSQSSLRPVQPSSGQSDDDQTPGQESEQQEQQ